MKIMFAVMLAMMVSACAGPEFRYTSDVGKKCFYSCKARHSECQSGCSGIKCMNDCRDAQTYCMFACDDVEEVKK